MVMEKYFVKSVETLIYVVNSHIKGSVWVKIQVGHFLAKLKGGGGGCQGRNVVAPPTHVIPHQC